jgi:hypothetical protein
LRNRVGRVQKAVRRALITSDGTPVPTGEIMLWAFPRLDGRYGHGSWRYWSVHRAARKFAVRVGKQGHSIVWAPNAELLRQIRDE